MFGRQVIKPQPRLTAFTVIVRERDKYRIIYCVGTSRRDAERNYRSQTRILGPTVIAIFEGCHGDVKDALPEFCACDPGGL